MPGAARSRRVEQCVYVEGGRRCRRSGTGDPAICNAHRVAFMEASRASTRGRASRIGDGIFDLVDRIVSGKKVTKKVAKEAFDDARNIIHEIYEQQPSPSPGIPHGQRRPPPPPPPPDPEQLRRAAQRQAAQRARQVLGFGPQDHLTEDLIKKRHRELAKKHHPDRGGSLDKMKEINAAVDVLLDSLVP